MIEKKTIARAVVVPALGVTALVTMFAISSVMVIDYLWRASYPKITQDVDVMHLNWDGEKVCMVSTYVWGIDGANQYIQWSDCESEIVGLHRVEAAKIYQMKEARVELLKLRDLLGE
jgi:hypothetical protein